MKKTNDKKTKSRVRHPESDSLKRINMVLALEECNRCRDDIVAYATMILRECEESHRRAKSSKLKFP